MARNLEYLGVGLAHPLRVDQFGRIALADGLDNIRQAIIHRLGTPRGSILFNRGYGSDLHRLPFEPNTETMENMLRLTVEKALSQEKRIRFTDMDVRRNLEAQRLDLAVTYTVRASNQVDSLIYPFYLANK